MKLSVHCNAQHYLSSSLIHCRCQGSSNKRRPHPLKEEMILALYSFRENSEDNEDDMELDVDREADSSNWSILLILEDFTMFVWSFTTFCTPWRYK